VLISARPARPFLTTVRARQTRAARDGERWQGQSVELCVSRRLPEAYVPFAPAPARTFVDASAQLNAAVPGISSPAPALRPCLSRLQRRRRCRSRRAR
jgi:hypothetical protein